MTKVTLICVFPYPFHFKCDCFPLLAVLFLHNPRSTSEILREDILFSLKEERMFIIPKALLRKGLPLTTLIVQKILQCFSMSFA